ncbi:unnamed protein product, partial [Polarella glacialis]
VRPIGAHAEADGTAEAWIREKQSSQAQVEAGEVFRACGQAEGGEFGVVSCVPARGSIGQQTEIVCSGLSVPVLTRVQLTCLEASAGEEDEDENQLYQDSVKPWLVKHRETRRQDGCHHLVVVSQDQVLTIKGIEFGVRALDPAGRCGAIDASTSIFVSYVETPVLTKVHVLPYGDTLPAAYSYDIFGDFIRPFLREHPFAIYGLGDHFAYRGVRFRVMATDPPQTAARVSSQTVVFFEGEPLRPTVWDLLPQELQEDLRRLPRGLQALLLSTMANEEAVRGRLTEVQEVLRRGQGLSCAEISSCGRTLLWSSAQHGGDMQQQCMVCLGDFAHGEHLRQLGCEHLFHQACIDEWLQRSAACPICKRPAVPGSSQHTPDRASPGLGANLLQHAEVACEDGQFGKVIGFDEASQRFRIRLQPGSEVRVLSLEQMAQRLDGVRLLGLRATELNGSCVQIVGMDSTRGRYQVRLSSAGAPPTPRSAGERFLGVRPDNCVLPQGSLARVVGLRANGSGSQWNGHFGFVVGFDQERVRHVLAMQHGAQSILLVPGASRLSPGKRGRSDSLRGPTENAPQAGARLLHLQPAGGFGLLQHRQDARCEPDTALPRSLR